MRSLSTKRSGCVALPLTIPYSIVTDSLRIAIQKSGRLHEESLRLLADCGLRVQGGLGKLKAQMSGFPAELLFLRDDDIPQYVADRVADVGFVGRNVVLEKGKAVREVLPLGFGRCRMSLAVKNGVDYPGPEWLQGRRIATTYTGILARYLAEQGVVADIHEISGSVEIAPSIGLADAIFDIVSSGSTLFMNGLKEVAVVLESEAVLIAEAALPPAKAALLDSLVFRMEAVKRSRAHKYILFNCPTAQIDALVALLPGMKSPSVLPLALPGWSSVHSVVPEESFWSIIEQLKAHGAQGILVVPIEKMVV
jgi:ATP phosphoribosyltransferase